jgi:hypothetical protein
MRAITGAIITAGAMIGLGLTAIGFGTRYSNLLIDRESRYVRIPWRDMDPALTLILITLLLVLLVGIGLTYLGLAYHHHRRHHEMLHRERSLGGSTIS